jgi:hypothetical protein
VKSQSFATHESIAATLHLYIDGARDADCELLRRAFLADADIRGSHGGTAVDWRSTHFVM